MFLMEFQLTRTHVIAKQFLVAQLRAPDHWTLSNNIQLHWYEAKTASNPMKRGILHEETRGNSESNHRFKQSTFLWTIYCDQRGILPSKTATNGMINKDMQRVRVVIKVQDVVESDIWYQQNVPHKQGYFLTKIHCNICGKRQAN